MEQIERIGVSLEKKLLSAFDGLIGQQGYQNRSEAVRDLIRRQLNVQRVSDPNAEAVAVVYIVYDHHSTKLMEKLTDLQHTCLLQIVCSMHIHLDAHDCMEIIVFRGAVGQINKVAENILSKKGVKLGRVNFVTTELDK
jgi:CopG family nickel-responsive transcriptional regulator